MAARARACGAARLDGRRQRVVVCPRPQPLAQQAGLWQLRSRLRVWAHEQALMGPTVLGAELLMPDWC